MYQRIFVFGSGFSKSISHKMRTLHNFNEDLEFEKDPRFKNLLDFYCRLKTVANSSDEINIESISTLILSKKLFRDNYEKIEYQMLRHQLLLWIYERINEYQQVDDQNRDIMKTFLQKFSQKDENPENLTLFATFNYDLLIENLLKDDPNFSFRNFISLNSYTNDHQKEPEPGKPRLKMHYLKLHGSLNWFRAPNTENFDLNNVYQVGKEDTLYNELHEKDIPVYIPMSHSKEHFLNGSLFSILWNSFMYYLEKAQEIIFIGYGFPKSDLANLALFLQYKSKIKQIVIQERENTNLENRLTHLFGAKKVINRDACEFLEQLLEEKSISKTEFSDVDDI
jgi:hypothetical protein